MFTEQQLSIIKYCAEECSRQKSGEESVYDMINAWEFMATEVRDYYPQTTITKEIVIKIGQLVEPEDNKNGFRRIPIFVGNSFHMEEKMNWERVPAALELLLESYYEGNLIPTHTVFDGRTVYAKNAEDQFYYEFENIHPFRDGNGRTGKILYNYLKGTLDNPVMPPNFWGSSNP